MPAKLTNMSAARVLARMCWQGKRQLRPEVAGVTVQPGVSSRAPEVQRSGKVLAIRDIERMMGIPPLPGQDISSSISKAGIVSSISQSSSRKKRLRAQLHLGWDLGPWRQVMRASSWIGFTNQSWWRDKELRVLCVLDPGSWVSRYLAISSSRVARGHITAVQSRKIGWRITPPQ
jgi:hypothetical protein